MIAVERQSCGRMRGTVGALVSAATLHYQIQNPTGGIVCLWVVVIELADSWETWFVFKLDDAHRQIEMPYGINARVIRDKKARELVKDAEALRRAYLYVTRNETLPAQVRYQAQLQLNNFSKYERPTTVKNRCTETGRGRGILSKWGLCRFQFRQKARAGEIAGVIKASW